MLAENGTYYLVGYYSPAQPNDGKHHRINVRTRVADVEIRAREGYDSPGKAAKPLAATPLDVLTRSAIQTRGLTMRVVAIPAPLSTEPSAAVIVGIELPTAVASRAGRIDFVVVAIDEEGKTRARVRFTTNFAASEKTSSPWTRTGSRIDLSPGQYQIRVAAAGGDNSQGSVFVDVSVPKFDTELGVGGLSLGAPSSIAITQADRLRGVLPLIPLATNEIAPGQRSLGTAPDQGLVEGRVQSADDHRHARACRRNDAATRSHPGRRSRLRGRRRQGLSSGASASAHRRELSRHRGKHTGPHNRCPRNRLLCPVATVTGRAMAAETPG